MIIQEKLIDNSQGDIICVQIKIFCIRKKGRWREPNKATASRNVTGPSPFSLLRWTGTSLLMLLLSSSVDSLRTRVGSFWASQSATLLSDAIIAACRVLKSLPPAPPLPPPLFLERDLWWSGVNFDTWSLMVTFPGEVLSNSIVKEAWPWAVEQKLQLCQSV